MLLRDHVVHQLALSDSGLPVNRLTFNLKAQCKLSNVQYQNVMSVLAEVADADKTKETPLFSLKPHLVLTNVKPQQYPFYSDSQKQTVQKLVSFFHFFTTWPGSSILIMRLRDVFLL